MNTRVILIFGNKLAQDGALTDRFRGRINLAVEHVRHDRRNVVVISGGRTRARFASEAESAYPFLESRLRERGLSEHVEILLESSSLTTPENVIFSQELLKCQHVMPDELIVVGGSSQIPRTVVIVERVWNLGLNPMKSFVANDEPMPRTRTFIDMVLLTFLAYVDPSGRSWVYGMLKKLVRNG